MSIAHDAMMQVFSNPDPHTIGVYNFVMKFYPSFAKKVFDGGDFMAKLVRSGMNPINILDAPICGRCEALAAYDGFSKRGKTYVKKCSCFKCGHSTVNPATFKEWMKDELKHKAPPEIAEISEYVVDAIATNMLKRAEQDLQSAIMRENARHNLIVKGMTDNIKPYSIEVNESSISEAEYNKLFEGTEIIE